MNSNFRPSPSALFVFAKGNSPFCGYPDSGRAGRYTPLERRFCER